MNQSKTEKGDFYYHLVFILVTIILKKKKNMVFEMDKMIYPNSFRYWKIALYRGKSRKTFKTAEIK